MGMRELLCTQWAGYPRHHQSRTNLLLHIVLVPLFLAGNVVLLVGLVRLSWVMVVAGIVATSVSMALQGRRHQSEPVPPEPFTSTGNALSRIFLEQWFTFPRFVLTGGWFRALRSAP